MDVSALKKEDLPHYTYDDYEKWEGKWEIIQGIPYAMTPAPVLKHQRVCRKIIWQLSDLLKGCKRCEVFLPIDWQISEDTIVQPDALVVCGDKLNGKKLETTPVIIFEVLSPSTSKNDRMLKYRLYEAAGVKYYCIVDPETSSANVFLFQADKYQQADEFKDGKIHFDVGDCEIQFDFRMIFQE
jgi:Uma2 family endonuclease